MSDDSETKLGVDDGEYRRTLEQALDKLGMGVVMSKEAHVYYVSDTIIDLLGYSFEQLTAVSAIAFVAPEQQSELHARLDEATPEDPPTKIEVRAAHASGRPIDLEVVNAQLGDEKNTLTLVRDVTEERAMMRRSEQAHRMESLGHLCAGIAHDFNNYLTAVRLLGEALVDAESAEERQDLFEELERVTRGAARLTHQLQTFSAAEPERPVALDLNIVVFEMADMLRRITGRQVELALNLEPGLPPAQVNAAQLQQVVVNLVLNASQAMPNGGRVTVRTSASDDWVVLNVADDGGGMQAEVLERAFEPLYTTDPEQRSGMGLSIVYGIARQCNGEVTIDSAKGEGTTVSLKLRRAHQLPERRSSSGIEPLDSADDLAVLVVESTDEAIGALVEDGLQRAGLSVQRCWLKEAADADLDVAALVMGTPPPAEPSDLIARYLESNATGRVVFIATPPDVSDDHWQSGRLQHVPKPFSVSELIAAVRGEDP